MFDLFMTGSETTSTSLTYVVLYCLHHPREAQKVREEVDRVVGRERRPHADDRENVGQCLLLLLLLLQQQLFLFLLVLVVWLLHLQKLLLLLFAFTVDK